MCSSDLAFEKQEVSKEYEAIVYDSQLHYCEGLSQAAQIEEAVDMLKKVWVAYFTGTKTTKKITEALGRKIADALKLPMDVYDFSPKISKLQ